MSHSKSQDERFAKMTISSVYPLYLAKVEKKGRTKEELHQVIQWLTGYGEKALQKLIKDKATFEHFFERATLNPNAHLITGVICGYRVEEIENPLTRQVRYLDKLVEALGGDAITGYEKKVQCCGGALAFSEPAKSQEMVKGIIESAYDHGADLIVTPCPVCQMNVEVYQDEINATYGTQFKMPVVYYSNLMAVAFGRSAKDAALNGQIIPAKALDDLAAK